jgi:dihydroorotase
MTWQQIVERMSIAPARILGVVGGSLSIGAPADVTIVDPEREWTIDAQKFYSKSRNTCFDGKKVRGRAVLTIVGGQVVYDARREG